MIYKAGDSESTGLIVVDAMGKKIPWVQSFDTETKMAEVLIQAQHPKDTSRPAFVVVDNPSTNEREIASAMVCLHGCNIYKLSEDGPEDLPVYKPEDFILASPVFPEVE